MKSSENFYERSEGNHDLGTSYGIVLYVSHNF